MGSLSRELKYLRPRASSVAVQLSFLGGRRHKPLAHPTYVPNGRKISPTDTGTSRQNLRHTIKATNRSHQERERKGGKKEIAKGTFACFPSGGDAEGAAERAYHV